MDHNQQAVKKMSDKQMFALGLFAATTIISLLLTAMNVRAVIEYGWQVVLLCQMPMALTGFYPWLHLDDSVFGMMQKPRMILYQE